VTEQLPSPAGAPPASMALCSTCGVVRASRKSQCAHCNAQHGSTALTHPRSDTDFWVCIECSFQCRACGFDVPLNHLDMDGGVLCARCGLEQAFQVSSWQGALRSAHAVAELFDSSLPGLDADIATIGTRLTSQKHVDGGVNRFVVTASPGYPLCARCHAPPTITTTEAGAATVACAACDTRETYRLPVAARKMTHGALKAIVAVEHRSDRAAVTVDQTPGAIAVRCPSCSAPLPASDASKFLTCGFCKVTSRIPDHAWFRMSGKDPVSESMWLLFHGPSGMRKELEGRAREAADKERQRAFRVQREEERDEERRRQRQDEEARKAAAEVAEREIEEERRRRRERDVRTYMWMLLGGGAVFSATVVYFVARTTDVAPPPATASVTRDAGTSSKGQRQSQPPPPPAFASVRSCTCVSASNEGTDTYVLEAPTASHQQWRFDWTHHAGFVETESTVRVVAADGPAAVLPLPAGASKLLGMACDGPVVALVSGKVATGWAGPRGARAWNVSLPAAFTPKMDPTALAASEGLDVACAKALAVNDGVVALTLDSGKTVHLSLKDGRVK
jgi:hypothetical protein